MSGFLFNKMRAIRPLLTLKSTWGNTLVVEDREKILDTLMIWCSYLLDLACVSPADESWAVVVMTDWLKIVSAWNLVDLQKCCDATWIKVNNQVTLTDVFVRTTFKESSSEFSLSTDQSLVGRFLSPLKLLERRLMPPVSVDGSKKLPDHPTRLFLSALLTFPFKLNIEMDIKGKLTDEYVLFEEKLQKQTYPISDVNRVAHVIKEWVQDLDMTEFQFRHGPGTTADAGRLAPYKTDKLIPTTALRDLFSDIEVPWNDNTMSYRRWKNKIIFVPKSLKTYRVISSEPALLQYLQQGLSEKINHAMRRRLKWWNLENQEHMRRSCKEASRYAKSATIDLSSASDSVTKSLVTLLFADTPLLPFLLGTRSTHCRLPNKKTLCLEKFAPMGSALCFPIEMLVFGAICEASSRFLGLPWNSNLYKVYGDDIILDHRLVSEVLRLLKRFHFDVNTKKSYTSRDSFFRESCGSEYYKGVDIRPVRISRKFERFNMTAPDVLIAKIDLANRFFDHGCKLARRMVIFQITRVDHNVPFSYEGLIGLKTNNPTNFHLNRSRKGPHKRVVHTVVTSVPLKNEDGKVDLIPDNVRLNDWFTFKMIFPESDYQAPSSATVTVNKWKATLLTELNR